MSRTPKWITMQAAAVLLSLFTLAGCHSVMPVVAVEGSGTAMEQLAGRWEGSYESEENGREGTIQFELTGVGDTARGEILMLPAAAAPYQGSARGEQPRDIAPRRSPTLLPIRFVRIEEGQILGTLDEYLDPDCSCPVTTNFIGSIDGDEVRGIFAIRSRRTWLAYGEWRVHRVRHATN